MYSNPVFRLEDNRVVHALLVDFLESVLPVPSSFELPHDFRNKFTHTFQLNKWKFYRSGVGLYYLRMTAIKPKKNN